ncbi:MAG: hypothetical protein JXO22_02090 [Phycisphaerae bacterium]|nr:hypothetical protein [Phycisphaerae bacterium]
MYTKAPCWLLPSVVAALACGFAVQADGPAQADEPTPPAPNPAEPVDYLAWINETYGKGIKQNAADEYIKAFGLYEAIEKEHGEWRRDDPDWKAAYAGPWSDNPELEAWLNAAKPAIEAYERASLIEDCHFFSTNTGPGGDMFEGHKLSTRFAASMINMRLQPIGRIRSLAWAALADGWHAWKQGDHEKLVSGILLCLRTARHLHNQHSRIERLVGISLQLHAYGATLRAADLSPDAPAFAAELLPRFTEADRERPSLARVFMHERLIAVDMTQRIYVPDKQSGDYCVDADLFAEGWAMMVVGSSSGDSEWDEEFRGGKVIAPTMNAFAFDTAVAMVNDHYDKVDRVLRLPYREAVEKWGEFDVHLDGVWHLILRTLPRDLPSMHRLETRAVARCRGTRVVLHVLAHRHATGEYPAKLIDVPALRSDKELRTDPFSEEEFIYRRTDDGFTLYSVGEDFKDDGGKHDSRWGESDGGGDYVFWPVPEVE